MGTRRGFAMGPVIGVLAVALVVLVAWKLMIQLDHIPQGRLGADRVRGRAWTIAVTTVLVIFAVSGGLGALGYFAFRKSESAAGVGIAIPLALGVATFSYQHYRYHTGQMTGQATQASSTPTTRPPAPAPTTTMRPRIEPPQAIGTPPPPQPPPPVIAEPPSTTTTLQERPQTPVVTAPPRKPAPPPEPAEHPAVKPTLEAVKVEMDEECNALAEQATKLYDAMAQTPKPLKQDVEARLKLAQDATAAAARLHERLRDMSDLARERLEEAGVGSHEAASEAIRFSVRSGYTGASSAAFQLEHFAERAAAECNILRDNLGRWVLRQGKFSTSDKDLERRYESARFFVDSAVSRRDEIVGSLRR
jgi:outer membrane biosynthesis protein TonB